MLRSWRGRARVPGMWSLAALILGATTLGVATLSGFPDAPAARAGAADAVARPSVSNRPMPAESNAERPVDQLPLLAAPTPSDAASTEEARRAFVALIRFTEARELIGEAVPIDVARLIARGRYGEAQEALVAMARDGDVNAYEALERLLSSCPGKTGDPQYELNADARKARNEEMIRQARERGLSDTLAQRLRWSLDAINAHMRELWSELCPAGRAGEYQGLLAEARTLLPPWMPPDLEKKLAALPPTQAGARERNELMKAAEPEIHARLRRLADAGLRSAQLHLAHEHLFRQDDAAIRDEALALVRALAPDSPQAKLLLARCQSRCDIDPDEALRLTLEAARAGSIDALREVAGWRRLSEVDRYGWTRVHEQLRSEGCLGFVPFYTWAFRQAQAPDPLLGMSPHVAATAGERARTLLATEAPRLRSAFGCADS